VNLAEAFAELIPGFQLVEGVKPPAMRHEVEHAGSALASTVYPRNYVPHSAQLRAHALQSDETFIRFLVMCAGRRGGKTKAAAAQMVLNMLRDLDDKLSGRGRWEGKPHLPWVRGQGRDPEPFLRYFVLAPTHDLTDEPKIALGRYLGHVADPEPGLIVEQHDKPTIWWLRCGVRIDFLSGDTPERNVSHGYDGGWFEEAARTKSAVWRDNMRPALSDKRGWAIFSTTPMGRNWFWSDVWAKGNMQAAILVAKLQGCEPEELLDPEFACIAWTTADNDALPHLVEEMAIARRQLSDANWRRNYKADFDAFEGQCFDLLPKHLVGKYGAPFKRIWAGFDSGWSHRASCSVVIERGDKAFQEVFTDSAANVLPYGDDAWARRDRGDRSTWANRMWSGVYATAGQRWTQVPVFIPADRPDIAREWKRYGFNVQNAYQEHEPAVTWMSTALLNDYFFLQSEALWTCMTALHYPEGGKVSRKLWVDENDDEWDSLRYALSEVIASGMLPTRAPLTAMGWNRV
jgi:hypothetical protein